MPTAGSKHTQVGEFPFLDYTGGVITTYGPSEIPDNSLRDARNIRHSRLGGLRSRDGTIQVSNTALPAGANITAMTFYNYQYILAGDDNKLYYLDGDYDPVEIGDLSGIPFPGSTSIYPDFIEFNDILIICDGGVARYYNSIGTYGFLTGPKASFGVIRSNRLFLSGDLDNPSRVWFSNVNDPNDFTTIKHAGYIDIDPGDGASVVGMEVFGQTILIFKEGERRSIHQLLGLIPAEFDRQPLAEGLSGKNREQIISVGGDVYVANEEGALSMQKYLANRRIEEASVTRNIDNLYATHYGTAAYMAYCKQDSQLWMQFPNQGYFWTYDLITSAWFPYEFKFTPSCFQHINNAMHIGGADGHLYKLDPSVTEDDGVPFDVYAKTKFYDLNTWRTKLLKWIRLFGSAKLGCTGKLRFYINSEGTTYIHEEDFQLAISDDMTVDEATMLVADADFILDSASETIFNKQINFRCKNFSFGFEEMVPNTYPVYIRGVMITAAVLGMH